MFDSSTSENPTSLAAGRTSDPAALTFLILTLSACGMAALLALLPAAGHDQMWLLYAARLMLHGAPLYGSQVFETNPPLIVWLSTVPSALSSLTSIPDTTLGKCFVVALEVGIAALCLRLLRIARPTLTPAAGYALAFAYVVAVAVMPARDFGQRDHFLALFLLPYLFAAALRFEARPVPRTLAFLIGTLALLGVVLKPHQLLVVISVEAFLLLAPAPRLQRIVRSEMQAMLVAGLLFLAAIRQFAPLYWSVIVPIERDTYWAYGQRTHLELFGDAIQLHLLAVACIALAVSLGWRSTSAIARTLLVAGLAATLAFHLQGTGWYYHQLPALIFLSLAFALLLVDLGDRRHGTFPRWTPVAAAGLALLALTLTTHFMNYPFTDARSFPVDTPAPVLFANLPHGAAVLTLSPTVDDTIQPIFKYHLTLGERYPALLMMPALLRSEDPQTPADRKPHITPARLAELDRLQHQFMVEDLERWHPALILVQRCQDPAVHCQVLEDRHDDLLAFFTRDPAFAAIFAHYHYEQRSGPYDAYTLTH